ncbi:Noc2p family-domain-containing protein [Dichotomocladium elegans]|nr:Noc2p family-domain-containing protein [Dichotomocladium elegans]
MTFILQIAALKETKHKNLDKKEKKKSKDKKKDKKMSVEEFFNGGFDGSDEDSEIDRELGELETIEEKPDDDDLIVSEEDVSVKDDVEETDIEDEEMEEMETDDDSIAAFIDDEAEEDTDEDDQDDHHEELDDAEDHESAEEDDSEADSDEEENVKDSKKKLIEDIEKHKQELEELKERDPEFYEYLQKDENNLLNFDEDAEDLDDNAQIAAEDEDEDMDEDEEESELHKSLDVRYDDGLELLTKTTVSEWIKQVESKKSMKVMKKLLLAFKSAARMSNEEEQDNISFAYKIDSPKVFNMVVIGTLRNAPVVFDAFLKSAKYPSASKKWQLCEGIVKSYLGNLLHLLRNLTDSDMLYVATKESEKCSTYWVCFPKLVKEYLKVLLELWSVPSSSDNLRIQSFLAVRSLAVARVHKDKPNTYLDMSLKNIYLTFVRNCKSTNEHTLPAINLMRNMATQLYSIDQELSYQQAFVYIRQLAIHLRNAMQQKSNESYQTVYNWQYIHCIDFWSNVLADNCKQEESPLRPLVYPLVQVALGAIQLVPTAQYFPARFHIIRSMITMGRASQIYIPLAPYLMQLFESSELTNRAKPSTLKPLSWDIHIRAPKQYLHGRVYQDGVIEQLCECITEFYKSYTFHISFPEMVTPGIVAIKRFVKKSSALGKKANIKGNKKLLQLASKLEIKANFVLTQRAKADFSPSDDQKVQEFIDGLREKLQ